jgi:hypothetical protein
MLEGILIVCIVYACMYMPLRGKTFALLTPSQQQKVEKNYNRYMNSIKGRQNPSLKIEEYLPIIQKQALVYLITAIVVLPIYILAIVFVYSGALANL